MHEGPGVSKRMVSFTQARLTYPFTSLPLSVNHQLIETFVGRSQLYVAFPTSVVEEIKKKENVDRLTFLLKLCHEVWDLFLESLSHPFHWFLLV